MNYLKHLRIWTATLGLAVLCAPAISAEQPQIVELGGAEFATTAVLPAAAGGNVFVKVRVTARISQDVVKKINEGISSGKYRAPFRTNKEFMDIVQGSQPGYFDMEILGINLESRFYYFFQEKMKQVKTDPSIPDDLRRKANDATQKSKALLYQAVKVNDYAGAKLVFEQDAEKASVTFLASTKRGNKLVGKVAYTDKERPIFIAVCRVLIEEESTTPSVTITTQGNFDDIVKAAQAKNILVSK